MRSRPAIEKHSPPTSLLTSPVFRRKSNMEPVFTIPYSEYRAIDIVSRLISKHIRKDKKEGYCTMIPASRQQKGLDFAVVKTVKSENKCVTFQVKGSRAYFPDEGTKANKARRYKYTSLFNRFTPPEEADIVILMVLYPEHFLGNKVNEVPWKPVCLAFTRDELKSFMSSVKTRSGSLDSKFSFGFDHPGEIFLVRGEEGGIHVDYSEHLIENKICNIKELFD